MSTLVKFEAADFEASLSNARTAVADTSERLAELKAAGPASLPVLKAAVRHVTPIRTRLVEQRRITKRAIDDLAGDLLKRVAEVEDPLQHAIREIEARELNEAAARVAEAEAAEKARRDAEEAEREAERQRLAEENAKLRAELDAARAARMDEAAAKLNDMRVAAPKYAPEDVRTYPIDTAQPDPLGLAAAMDSVAAEMDAQHEPPVIPASFRGATCLQGTDADAINRFAGSIGEWMVREKPMLIEDAAKEWFALNVVDVFRTVYRKCKEYKS